MTFIRTAMFAALLSSCATIITGTDDTISIETTPPGAAFTSSAGHTGVTPAILTLPDKGDITFDFTLAGHQGVTAVSKARMSNWVIGNAVFGLVGIAMIVVDASSHGYTRSGLSVEMFPDGVTIPDGTGDDRWFEDDGIELDYGDATTAHNLEN